MKLTVVSNNAEIPKTASADIPNPINIPRRFSPVNIDSLEDPNFKISDLTPSYPRGDF